MQLPVMRTLLVAGVLSTAFAMRTPLNAVASPPTPPPEEDAASLLPTSAAEAEVATEAGQETGPEVGQEVRPKAGSEAVSNEESLRLKDEMQQSGTKAEETLKTKEEFETGTKEGAEDGMETTPGAERNVELEAIPEMEEVSAGGPEADGGGSAEGDEAEVRLGAFADDGLTPSDLKERYLVSALGLRRQRCAGAVGGRAVGGVCLDKAECALKRGLKAGSCALLGACCYFQHTCGERSHYKVSHFASPPTLTDQTECDFRVHVINRDICQIRVDMEQFSLAQPERAATPLDEEVQGGWRCLRDRFTVEAAGVGGGSLGFDALCGENAGQHLYIPVNASDGKAFVRLMFFLASRTQLFNASSPLAPARWLLRVTQLECAGAPPAAAPSPAHAAIAAAAHHHASKHMLQAADLDLIAPPGCLQYYPSRQGQYESFNYPALRYLSNLHYAICFRRKIGDCGIRHTVLDTFLLDFNRWDDPDVPPQSFVNRRCDTRNPDQFTHTSDDYLYVPNGIVSGDAANRYGSPFANKICGEALAAGDSISSYAPGPFFVYFHSDDLTFNEHISDWGFRFRFDTEAGSCPTADPTTIPIAG